MRFLLSALLALLVQSSSITPTPNGLEGVVTALAADTSLPAGTGWRVDAAADRSVEIWGTYGGATIIVEGSNSGTNWVTAKDYTDTDISFTTGTHLVGIRENYKFLRVTASGGDMTTAINARLVANN